MIGMVDLSKKGTGIHGIVEEYVAKGDISIGGFVKYLQEFDIGKGTEIENKGTTNFNLQGFSIKAVALDNNRVFIAHTLNNTYYNLYGIICTIEGDTINIGTDTQITNRTYTTSNSLSIAVLNENKILITYNTSNSSHSYYYLYGIVCTIDGTTITTGAVKSISSETYSGFCTSVVALSESKVFIAHSYGSSYYLYGIVCTIDGTTITTGSDTKLFNNSYAGLGYKISAIKLNENKIFIAHSSGALSQYYLYGVVCTINEDNVITVGTDTQLSTSDYSGYQMSAAKLADDKVFIAHSYSSSYYLYGVACRITDTTITKLIIDTQLNTNEYSAYQISTTISSENEIFIAHSIDKSEHYLSATICTMTTSLTVNKYEQLSTIDETGNQISAVVLTQNKVFIAHQYTGFSRYLGATLCIIGKMFEKVSKLDTLIDKIYRYSSK